MAGLLQGCYIPSQANQAADMSALRNVITYLKKLYIKYRAACVGS